MNNEWMNEYDQKTKNYINGYIVNAVYDDMIWYDMICRKFAKIDILYAVYDYIWRYDMIWPYDMMIRW